MDWVTEEVYKLYMEYCSRNQLTILPINEFMDSPVMYDLLNEAIEKVEQTGKSADQLLLDDVNEWIIKNGG